MNYSDFHKNRVRYNINTTNKATLFIKLIINNVIIICLIDSSKIYSLSSGI